MAFDSADTPSFTVLGLPVHRVSLDEAVARVVGWALPVPDEELRAASGGGEVPVARQTRAAISMNPELVVRVPRDPAAAEAVSAADLRYPDGIGIAWAAGRMGVPGVQRVAGVELAERTLAESARLGLGVYLLGAAAGVAEEASAALRSRMPGLRVVGHRHGYFAAEDEEEIVGHIRDSGADILLVALGAPRQEIFIHRHREHLGAGVALGVGGSFDVWSGRVRRAPVWIRDRGLEWLFRLVTDPRRLKRQSALPVFAWRVLRSSEKGRRRRPHLPRTPSDP